MRPGHGGGGRTERAPSTTQRESLETEERQGWHVQCISIDDYRGYRHMMMVLKLPCANYVR